MFLSTGFCLEPPFPLGTLLNSLKQWMGAISYYHNNAGYDMHKLKQARSATYISISPYDTFQIKIWHNNILGSVLNKWLPHTSFFCLQNIIPGIFIYFSSQLWCSLIDNWYSDRFCIIHPVKSTLYKIRITSVWWGLNFLLKILG